MSALYPYAIADPGTELHVRGLRMPMSPETRFGRVVEPTASQGIQTER